MSRRSKSQPPSVVSKNSSKFSKNSRDSGVDMDIDSNFRPIKILAFRNGDQNDPGTEIPVTRRQFKHWLVFLDFVGKRINMPAAVHYLYSTRGHQLRHFNELKDGRKYVAVSDYFKEANYGAKIVPLEKQFKIKQLVNHQDPAGLASPESLEIYLQQKGYAEKDGGLMPKASSHVQSKIDHGYVKKKQKTLKKSRSVPRNMNLYSKPKPPEPQPKPSPRKKKPKRKRKPQKAQERPIMAESPAETPSREDSGNFSQKSTPAASESGSSRNTGSNLSAGTSRPASESRRLSAKSSDARSVQDRISVPDNNVQRNRLDSIRTADLIDRHEDTEKTF